MEFLVTGLVVWKSSLFLGRGFVRTNNLYIPNLVSQPSISINKLLETKVYASLIILSFFDIYIYIYIYN